MTRLLSAVRAALPWVLLVLLALLAWISTPGDSPKPKGVWLGYPLGQEERGMRSHGSFPTQRQRRPERMVRLPADFTCTACFSRRVSCGLAKRVP